MKFTFNPDTGLYTNEKGKTLTEAEMRRIQAESESKHRAELIALALALVLWRQLNGLVPEAEKLTADELIALAPEGMRAQVAKRVRELGPVSMRDFQVKMQDEISLAHRVNTVLGSGGFASMTIAAWNYAASKVRTEQAYEVRFAAQVIVGQQSPAQITNRAAMYSESPYKTFSGAKTNQAKSRGVLEARRILDPRAEHCVECPQLASEEWERIENVPEIGTTICGARCRCYISYRRTTEESANDDAVEAAA